MENGITVERALEIIAQAGRAVSCETLLPENARGRTLAQSIISPINQPPFPRSPLDGYALLGEDTVGADKLSPVQLEVIDCVYAGGWSDVTVGHGQAVRIMTGAPIPDGADCVIRQEDTDLGEKTVSIFKSVRPFENYCCCGEDFKAGEVLLPEGTILGAVAMGLLSGAGLDCRQIKVRCAPKIFLLCTGDELADNDVKPLPKGKIYSSNYSLLKTRLQELGMEVLGDGRLIADDPDTVAETIHQALKEADAVITTGGVSVGEKDIFHQVLPLLRAERLFWRVKLKPGTPMMFSTVEGKPVLCLSGNPFAAEATFELFGRRLLACLADNPSLEPLKVTARLANAFPKSGGTRRFVRGTLKDGEVTLPQGHSSGQLRSALGTNCLAELVPSDTPPRAGDTVNVYIL